MCFSNHISSVASSFERGGWRRGAITGLRDWRARTWGDAFSSITRGPTSLARRFPPSGTAGTAPVAPVARAAGWPVHTQLAWALCCKCLFTACPPRSLGARKAWAASAWVSRSEKGPCAVCPPSSTLSSVHSDLLCFGETRFFDRSIRPRCMFPPSCPSTEIQEQAQA